MGSLGFVQVWAVISHELRPGMGLATVLVREGAEPTPGPGRLALLPNLPPAPWSPAHRTRKGPDLEEERQGQHQAGGAADAVAGQQEEPPPQPLHRVRLQGKRQ